ncbi:SGNH/GDSL hydrolase family protein [Leptothoe spongobia]|uniref:SGNH/GDSL hydrolase family protein n=1 Tax=Leptothoe spongobia TAU-MAC 1115 TaxID=1967444 RepID=A0A947DDX4_9CYAN|nr:SGNH/GDSL hydrolase family protein [Leptothoe spongobia]MBT9314579.1 SGNH/GDSL hydrolase family protein [Leptothoe spongobia TAU-MAC 1115]
MRKCYILVAFLLCASLGIEIALRKSLGLASPALSVADQQTGYRFKPNQRIFRFGKYIEYNQYSQRSEAIAEDKTTKAFRVLMTGDSVLNGGNPTDQADILTEKLEQKISANGVDTVEVLNASAGSWGIGNQAGYIEKFGLFDSDIVILQIGSHDLVQPTSTSDVVGRSTHPDKKPLLAIQELLVRYLWPRVITTLKLNQSKGKLAEEIPTTETIDRQFQQNMASLTAIDNFIDASQMPTFVLFIPSRKDLIPEFSEPDYKAEFLEVLEELEISVIDVHQAWSSLPDSTVDSYFRDKVHLNPLGNEAVASLVFQKLCATDLSMSCKF